jgi:hypothetical protein
MVESTITLDDILPIVKRNAVRAVICFLLAIEGAILARAMLPKRYKSTALINIQSSYFRNSQVSDLVAEVTDPAEIQAQRQAIMRMALNNDFLDTFGERHSVYQFSRTDPRRVMERQNLLGRIEYFTMGANNFQISVTAEKSQLAFTMIEEVLDQIQTTFFHYRLTRLMNAKTAIQSQVQLLSESLRRSGDANSADMLQAELNKLNANINVLRGRYTENHPEMIELKSKAALLKSQLAHVKPAEKDSPPPESIIGEKAPPAAEAKKTMQEIFDNMLKKLTSLNVLLDMEKDSSNLAYFALVEKPTIPLAPVWPQSKVLLAFAIGAAIVMTVAQGLFFEIRRLRQLTPERAAADFDIPLLGELKPLGGESAQLLLEGRKPSRLLPYFKNSGQGE